MSDTIKKWHEMQEDRIAENNNITATSPGTFIYESPDNGETVYQREFGQDIRNRKVIKIPTSELKKKAYTLLCEYDEDVIRMAAKILDIGE